LLQAANRLANGGCDPACEKIFVGCESATFFGVYWSFYINYLLPGDRQPEVHGFMVTSSHKEPEFTGKFGSSRFVLLRGHDTQSFFGE
jgi:hypothetical protein